MRERDRERQRGRKARSERVREGERQSGVAIPHTQEVPAAHGLVGCPELFERERVRVCVCVRESVCERDGGRDRGKERQRERGGERQSGMSGREGEKQSRMG